MKLKHINKAEYRSKLSKTIRLFIICFAVISVALGQLLITIFAEPSIVSPADIEASSNFKYNLTGVILGLLFTSWLLYRNRNHEFLMDIFYIWQLKQVHNRIFNRLRVLEKAANDNEVNALIILNYYYTSIKQVHELDDNTLVSDELAIKADKIAEKISSLNLCISTEQYSDSLLLSYSQNT